MHFIGEAYVEESPETAEKCRNFNDRMTSDCEQVGMKEQGGLTL